MAIALIYIYPYQTYVLSNCPVDVASVPEKGVIQNQQPSGSVIFIMWAWNVLC